MLNHLASKAIARLNWLAHRPKTRNAGSHDTGRRRPYLDHLFDSIRDAGSASRKGQRIQFTDPQAIRFSRAAG